MMNLIESLHELELLVFESFEHGNITELERNMLIDEIKAKESSHNSYMESTKESIEKIKERLRVSE